MLIEKYTPQWINDYASIKCEIEKGLHGLNLTMEHIGSTSVPDLDSKPIIDIDIIYYHQGDFEKINFFNDVYLIDILLDFCSYISKTTSAIFYWKMMNEQ